MYSQACRVLSLCSGCTGHTIWPSHTAVLPVLKLVRLQGLLPEKKIFEVHIEKGHKHNAKVVLRGEAGYSEPGIQPGDVIFVLEQKPHKTFKRIQADLVIEKVCHISTPLFLLALWLPSIVPVTHTVTLGHAIICL